MKARKVIEMNEKEGPVSVSRVLLDDYGETHCEMCGRTLMCDEFGDMPDVCPHCKRKLDYSIFDPHQGG